MFPGEWDNCSWAVQRMYVEGLEQEGLISRGADETQQLEEAGITGRKADTGSGVIDLNAMRAELAGRG